MAIVRLLSIFLIRFKQLENPRYLPTDFGHRLLSGASYEVVWLHAIWMVYVQFCIGYSLSGQRPKIPMWLSVTALIGIFVLAVFLPFLLDYNNVRLCCV